MFSPAKIIIPALSYLAFEADAISLKAKEYSDYSDYEASDDRTYYLPKYYANVCDEIALETPGYSNILDFEIIYSENKYLKVEELGSGHFSTVYKGIDIDNDQIVAVKVIE